MNTNTHESAGRSAQRPLRFAFCFGVLAIFLTSQAHGQTIRLQSKASVVAGDEVRLGQIATITGTDPRTAEKLAETVVLAMAPKQGSQTVKAEQILMAVVTQYGPGGMASRLQLIGSASCQISTGAADPRNDNSQPTATSAVEPDRPIAMAAVIAAETPRVADSVPTASESKTPATPTSTTEKSPAAKTSTLAKLLTDRLLQENDAAEADLRVTFETITPLLDQAAAANQKWQFRPMTRSTLGTVQYEAQLIEGSRVIQKITIQAKVQRRIQALVAVAPITRGDIISKTHFHTEDVWLDRKMITLIVKDSDVLGMEATRPVAVGGMLDQRDFKAAEMAARGDAVTVIFASGGLKVQMKGRATESGKLHDVIQVRNDQTNELYQATLIGKRLALVGPMLDEAAEEALRQGH